jgi:CheY-like chemotaxis protein
LRHKLTTAGAPHDLIATAHGRGYYLMAPACEIGSQTDVSSSSPPAEVHQSEPQYLTFLNEAWGQFKLKSEQHLLALTQAVKALQGGILSPQDQEKVRLAAHTLAGTLGMFGVTTGMQFAQDLEHLLDPEVPLQPHHADRLKALVTALSQEIAATSAVQPPSLTTELPWIGGESLGAKIMIVDDDQQWLNNLPKILQPWGFQLTTLDNLQCFWSVLEAVSPDLLVLDVNMPQVNGLELCQSLRSDRRWSRLPIMFLSVLTDTMTQNRAFALGADDYLCKPIQGVDLANRILNRLRRVQAWAS